MSDRVAKSDPDSDGTARKSMNHYQAAWMDHWKHARHKPSTEVRSHLLHSPGPRKDDHEDFKKHPLLSRTEIAANISTYSQGFRDVSEDRTDDTLKKRLRMASMKSGKEILDGQPLPLFSNLGNRENAMSSKNNAGTSSGGEAVKYQIDLNDGHNSIGLGRSEWTYPEGISRVPQQLIKPHEFLENNTLAVSSSFRDNVGSCSKIVPYLLNSAAAPTQSFAYPHENIDQPSPVVASKEHLADAKLCSYSNFWVHEKKADSLFESRRVENSLSRQNVAPLLLHDQSRNNSQNKQSQKVEHDSRLRLLPSLGSPEAEKSGKAYDEYLLLPRIPRSVHDVKTMRICTTIDSVEELPTGPSKISQTTHQFFITKKTGVNLTEGGQEFRDATVSPKLKGNMFNEFLSLSPSFSFHGQQGVKLQPLESSTDSERKENVQDIRTSTVCLKNESSVETDAMELDVFQKSLLSGVALCPLDQNIKGVHKPSLSETGNGIGEAGNEMVNGESPDMNERLPALPAAANSIDDGGTSTSRTQSLDADHLLFHAEQPSNSNATACPDGPLEPDPSSRWVKRLKLSTSHPFASGTKISKMGEVSSRVKMNKISKIMNCSKTSSEPTVGRSHVRSKLALDQHPVLLKSGESSSSGSGRKSQEISLSRTWIHRWCRHIASPPNKKPDAALLCEPQSSKATSDELQEKQFPSLAAMALMGKAMNGFHPCEFRRKGSLIVWNT
ncbi:hypothetical protein ES332_D12G031600v1 [Gossypium tomentosum]|uniref:Uncharacterized protein n=1 Tax=Gossypium tomentosum TaxID=34277 RepID=A0A5D2I4G3_GOSTO|nr:hypothetical protein ES332_D12G031600v1 [Gossypium tomentosum]TYH37316.1 hypothetical protein ES332_D12G031600v1 [Gossypium tomentosum]TYH37317.1 hypothetical protein ES332_D12G031600v1 [Gossypium tomentosum]TYH37318.1 hypothetical protein ES332_D12G031600v1 [Gossypium tomentosum]